MDGAPSKASRDEPSEVEPSDGSSPEVATTEGPPSDVRLAAAADELRAAATELEAAVHRADQAEQALAGREALVDALLAFVARPLMVLDPDLKVIGWSGGAEEAWDRSADDALGRRWSRLGRSIDPEAPASELDDLVAKAAPGTTVPFGDTLVVQAVGDDERVRYLVVTLADG